jgi:hypothetical protein
MADAAVVPGAEPPYLLHTPSERTPMNNSFWEVTMPLIEKYLWFSPRLTLTITRAWESHSERDLEHEQVVASQRRGLGVNV